MKPNTGDRAVRWTMAALILATMAGVLQPGPVNAQSLAVELELTSAASTQKAAAAATQLRAFGDVWAGVEFFVEGAWAARHDDDDTDVFGAAYPYNNKVQVIEAYGERVFRPGKALLGIRAGRFRTPFGIYNRSDHAYSGFLRAPLMRYDDYFALSNNFLEHGAEVIAGVPQLFVAASVGKPADVGIVKRRDGVDRTIRLQGYHGPLIVGVSHIRALPYQPARFSPGHMRFTGLDARWMLNGVQFRGEWITGRPFDGTSTHGGYVDAIVHRRGMGPLTAVLRVESLVYDTPRTEFATSSRRVTTGGRIRLPAGLNAQFNLIHQTGTVAQPHRTAFDVALTFSTRVTARPAGGGLR